MKSKNNDEADKTNELSDYVKQDIDYVSHLGYVSKLEYLVRIFRRTLSIGMLSNEDEDSLIQLVDSVYKNPSETNFVLEKDVNPFLYQAMKECELSEDQDICFFYTDIAEWVPGKVQYIDDDGSVRVAFYDIFQRKHFSRTVPRKYVVPFNEETMCQLLDEHDVLLHHLDDIKSKDAK